MDTVGQTAYVAYGGERLNSAYEGPIVSLSSSGDVQEITSDHNGETVTTFYDQSGNGRDGTVSGTGFEVKEGVLQLEQEYNTNQNAEITSAAFAVSYPFTYTLIGEFLAPAQVGGGQDGSLALLVQPGDTDGWKIQGSTVAQSLQDRYTLNSGGSTYNIYHDEGLFEDKLKLTPSIMNVTANDGGSDIGSINGRTGDRAHSGYVLSATSKVQIFGGSNRSPAMKKFYGAILWDTNVAHATLDSAASTHAGYVATPTHNIIFAGDSITEGALTGTLDNAPFVSLTEPATDPTTDWIYNVGRSSTTLGSTGNLSWNDGDKYQKWLGDPIRDGSGYKNIIVILLGSNDFAQTVESAATVWGYLNAWLTWLDGRTDTCKYVLGTVMDRTSFFDNGNDHTSFQSKQAAFNTEIRDYVTANPTKAVLWDCDVVTNMTDSTNLTYFTDGTHPTTAGHAALAPSLRTAITAAKALF
jgi:lysophospholipase L1-like esterase